MVQSEDEVGEKGGNGGYLYGSLELGICSWPIHKWSLAFSQC